ncbi:MAG: fumarylacetoacetate hydrolase family protein [Archaeoglobaceae archaeon]|nr:fumarylacetoacetate hydrolase family protein [Archaeoglobaceae archaeon]MDW8118402.1 fumarylacetoacetate hydrolase family protein [Archaeoglobaceae archaeon]
MIGRFLANGKLYEGKFELNRDILVFGSLEFPVACIKFLPPVIPSKIVAVGLNYLDHAEELGMPTPEEPIIFMKPPSAVIGDGDSIIIPGASKRVDYEGELAVVIGKRCRNVSKEKAKDFILGYTCFNDVTARDLQAKDGQWTRAKSFDTFAPLGPYVVEIDDPRNLKIETRVNGEIKQRSNTSNMIFDVYSLIEFISSIMTLEAGDVIATGTPAGIGMLKSKDFVEVEIEKIGVLRNSVIDHYMS